MSSRNCAVLITPRSSLHFLDLLLTFPGPGCLLLWSWQQGKWTYQMKNYFQTIQMNPTQLIIQQYLLQTSQCNITGTFLRHHLAASSPSPFLSSWGSHRSHQHFHLRGNNQYFQMQLPTNLFLHWSRRPCRGCSRGRRASSASSPLVASSCRGGSTQENSWLYPSPVWSTSPAWSSSESVFWQSPPDKTKFWNTFLERSPPPQKSTLPQAPQPCTW